MQKVGLLRKYKHLLPLTENTPLITLGEGDTPLLKSRYISDIVGKEVYLKYEGTNPTGSFKDRGMVLAVSKAVEGGATGIICASTGNTSASAAAYAARMGIPCYVILPSGKVALGKLTQAMIHGAKVISVEGNFDDALSLVIEASKKFNIAIVNSVNKYRLRGQQTASWEIVDVLGDAPDMLAIPVGNAGNISAYFAGFVRYFRLGKSTKIPKMYGFQAKGASPLVKGHFIDNPETIATAIRIGRPVNAKKALGAVKVSGGKFYAVTDEEILEAYKILASKEGIFVEPASAASVAGLIKLAKENLIPQDVKVIVAVLTGHGLKDPDTVFKIIPEPVKIKPSIGELKEFIGR